MKITNNFELFQRASPAKPGRKFLSFLIDALILFITSYLIFLGGYNIVESTDSFKKSEQIVKTEIKYYNNLVEETHLVSFTNEVRNENDIFALDNISKLLIYSDETYNWFEKGVEHFIYRNDQKIPVTDIKDAVFKMNTFGNNETRTEYVASSYESDDIAYFYTNYVKNNNENNNFFDVGLMTYETYYQEKFQKTMGSDFSIYFEKMNKGFPFALKMEKAINIYNYYFLNSDSTGYGKESFVRLNTLYSNLQMDAEKLLLDSKEYHNNHFVVYQEHLNAMGNMYCLAMVLSIAIAYILVFVPSTLIFKNGVTIGKLCLGLGIIEKDGTNIKPLKLTFRMFVEVIGFIGLSILIPILPPFAGSYSVLYTTLFNIGNFSVNLMIIDFTLIILSAINGCFALLTHYKTSLLDIITKELVVDKNHLDEYDYDERDESSL